jgi:hypothetical protein
MAAQLPEHAAPLHAIFAHVGTLLRSSPDG